MKMQRREFLHSALAGAGGLVFGPRFLFAQDQPAQSFAPSDIVELAKTKIKVSRVGFGTGMRGGNRQSNQTRLGKETFEELLRFSFERGVRLFDLADLYGSHPFVIPALKEIPRKQFALVSKIWFRRGGIPEAERPAAETVVQRFCKEIKTDYIDIVQLHCVTSATWPDELADYMNDLEKLKKKGMIRAHGLSCHSLEALAQIPQEPWVDVVHARINHTGAKMDAKPEQVVPVLQKIHDAGKAIIGMKLVGEGDFRQSDEMRNQALDFVLNLGCVDAMIVGFEKKWEIDDFAARVKNVKPRPAAAVA
ncbi:MAG: aldo/keto reductase [Sedimentisphaerales bacterium]|nr:aldo/keto reductase [Sedimentisphaerales bacterium]